MSHGSPSPIALGAVTVPAAVTVQDVLADLLRRPGYHLIECWHWKASLFSALIRFSLFFGVNLSSGLEAAWGAALAEFIYRLIASGCYGSMTQAFRRAEPAWQANLTAMFLLPVFQHGIEFTIHWLRGTPKLLPSILVSMIFTVFSTLFNLYSMRRGSLIVGAGAQPLWKDILRFPSLLASFVASGPKLVWRSASGWRSAAAPR
ncbi:MAG: hypothetical protein NTZ56_14500 [Acidobacteria bacterium]|nr:hypothetical protein [Acidobacteriota bacterium]